MARLTITKAIELSPIGKTHFYAKYIETGKISVCVDSLGKKYIDSAELIRVFGELVEEGQEQPKVSDTVPAATEQSELVKALREQIAESKEREQFYQERIVSLTNRLEAPANTKRINIITRWWYSLDNNK